MSPGKISGSSDNLITSETCATTTSIPQEDNINISNNNDNNDNNNNNNNNNTQIGDDDDDDDEYHHVFDVNKDVERLTKNLKGLGNRSIIINLKYKL